MAMLPWTPTHRVPDEGLAAWTEPSPLATAHPPLAGGLDVVVLEWRGDWARVRCDNGWETWVDGRRLAPVTTSSTATTRRFGRGAVTALIGVTALVIVAAALVVAGGGDDDGPATPAGTEGGTEGGSGVELRIPDGWATSADGLTAARDRADLTADVPSGPRVRALPVTSPPTDEDLVFPEPTEGEPAVEPVSEPETLDVGGRRVVAITLREHEGGAPIVRRYLGGPSPTGVPVLFVLEAPEGEYERHAAVLATVPGWAS